MGTTIGFYPADEKSRAGSAGSRSIGGYLTLFLRSRGCSRVALGFIEGRAKRALGQRWRIGAARRLADTLGMSRPGALIVIWMLAGLAACSPTDQDRSSLTDSLWEAECQQVLGPAYKACFGPGWGARQPRDRSRYTFYELSIEETLDDKSSRVLFSKRLEIQGLPQPLLSREAHDIVSFDHPSMRVTFDLGREQIAYVIKR